MDKKELGLLIRAARKEQGFTQEGLAKATGTTKSRISAIETGNDNITIERLNTLAFALNRRINPDLLIK